LKANRGKSVVIPGLYQDAFGRRAGAGHQRSLGNVGKTVTGGRPAASPDQIGDLKGWLRI
jgi:hypothetical protein